MGKKGESGGGREEKVRESKNYREYKYIYIYIVCLLILPPSIKFSGQK